MRLLSLNIENFGKLSDYQVDFSSNPAIFLEDNGWGKTTLATFIKVMFYGFAGGQKRGLENNERKRYMPWNKGAFGGSIRFEAGGKEYEISRSFGSKEADDDSSLIDLSTKLETSDFNKNRLGEELFNIDEESFVRTVFIGQGKISVRNDKNNIEDGISAKIGNLTDATDDVNNYEKVSSKLKDRINGLKHGNKLGVINQITARVTELEANVNRKDFTLTSIKDLENKITQEKEDIKDNKEKLALLDEELKKVSKAGEYYAKKKALEELFAEVKSCKEKVSESESFFTGKIPTEDILNEYYLKAREIDALKAVINENSVSEDKKSNTEIKSEDIHATISEWRKKENLSSELRNVKMQADNIKLTLDMDKKRREEEWIRNQNEKKALFLANRELARKQDKIKSIVLICIGIALVIIGLVLPFIVGASVKTTGMCVSGLGAVILLVGIVMAVNKKNNGSANAEYKEEPMPEFTADKSALDKAINDATVIEQEIQTITENVKRFFTDKGLEFDTENVERDLYALRDDLKEVAHNKEKEQKCEEAKNKLEDIYSYLNGALSVMGVSLKGEYIDTLDDINNKILLLKTQKEQVDITNKKYEEKKTELESYNVAEIEGLRSTEEISVMRDELDDIIDAQHEVMDEYKKQLDEKTSVMEEIENDEEELISLKEELKDKKHKYDIISQTKAFLDKAKEQLTARYMEPISDVYTKYYSFITTQDLDSFEIDANINVTKKELGMAREVVSLSQGLRDLTDIALRMALVDVMYMDEKPFVVMDDPFVNLDQAKVDKAKEFIEEIAKDYQVIYFTCHGSRA